MAYTSIIRTDETEAKDGNNVDDKRRRKKQQQTFFSRTVYISGKVMILSTETDQNC